MMFSSLDFILKIHLAVLDVKLWELTKSVYKYKILNINFSKIFIMLWCAAVTFHGARLLESSLFLYASPATAANCILTDYQHEAVNHQPRELERKRVRGCFQQIEMEKMIKSKMKQKTGEWQWEKRKEQGCSRTCKGWSVLNQTTYKLEGNKVSKMYINSLCLIVLQ